MEHKFKKGDKVRCIDAKCSIFNTEDEYVVSSAKSLFLYFDEDTSGGWFQDRFELVEPAQTDGWIEWSGGDRPVAAGTTVNIKFQSGTVDYTNYPEAYYWKHDGNETVIAAYRIVKESTTDSDDPQHNVVLVPTCEVDAGASASEQEDIGSAATSKHYNSKLIQPIQIAQMVLTVEEFKGAMKFNIMKYTQRAGSKEGESSQKDWNKALQYKLWLELAEAGVVIDPKRDIV